MNLCSRLVVFFFLRMPPWNIPISEETKWQKQILKPLALNVQTIERFHCSTVNQLNLTCNIPTPRPSADTFREPAAATSGICSQQNFKSNLSQIVWTNSACFTIYNKLSK